MSRASTARTTRASAARQPQRKAAARPSLRVVPPAPRRESRAPFAILSLVIVGTGLLALLLLNTVVAQNSFRLHELDRRAVLLHEREQQLRREVAQLESPETLAARAAELGLQPGTAPAFLRLVDGSVLGKPSVAKAPAVVRPSAPAPTAASASPAPSR